MKRSGMAFSFAKRQKRHKHPLFVVLSLSVPGFAALLPRVRQKKSSCSFSKSCLVFLASMNFDSIPDAVADIRKGRMVIVTDDADRENEGDLVMAASKVKPEAGNFMGWPGRGLICVPISNERADQLGLQRMVAQNREKHNTDFTVSVDA